MRKAILICVFFMMIFGISSISFAQDPSKELAAQNEAQLKMMAEQAAAQKAYLAETIVGLREAASARSFDPQYRASLVRDLTTLPGDRLQALQSSGGYDSSDNAVVQNLGDISADLVYTPVTPCRIIDTRNPGSLTGIIAANTTRGFYASDPGGNCVTGYSCQGGSTTNCGVPHGPATAVMINYVAIGPAAAGTCGPGPMEALCRPPRPSTIYRTRMSQMLLSSRSVLDHAVSI